MSWFHHQRSSWLAVSRPPSHGQVESPSAGQCVRSAPGGSSGHHCTCPRFPSCVLPCLQGPETTVDPKTAAHVKLPSDDFSKSVEELYGPTHPQCIKALPSYAVS